MCVGVYTCVYICMYMYVVHMYVSYIGLSFDL